jgi:MFS superfamily sulfate permease-like transporter
VLKWLPHYTKQQFIGDLSAGFTVGVMMVAQGIAYAPLATRPTISGLYTAFFPVIIYALLGTSRSLSLGPEIITSTLIGQTITAICAADPTLGACVCVCVSVCVRLCVCVFLCDR